MGNEQVEPESNEQVDPESNEQVDPEPTSEAAQWLRAHNIYRCMHGADPVVWSEAMYEDAKNHFQDAETLVHSDSYNLEPPIGPAGENLYYYWSSQGPQDNTPEAASKAWYDEVNLCTSFPGCNAQGAGHFTCMIWAGVKEIGCFTNEHGVSVCRYRSDDQLNANTCNMMGSESQQVFAPTKTEAACALEIDQPVLI